MKHPRAYWTFRRRAIVSGLLSRYCRYHGLESVSRKIRRKTESRIEESETESNFDNRLLAKIKINGFTNLLPRFIVRLRLIHMVPLVKTERSSHDLALRNERFYGDKRYYGNLPSRRQLLTGAVPFESALPYMGCCTLSGFVNTGLVLAGLVPPRRCTY